MTGRRRHPAPGGEKESRTVRGSEQSDSSRRRMIEVPTPPRVFVVGWTGGCSWLAPGRSIRGQLGSSMSFAGAMISRPCAYPKKIEGCLQGCSPS